MTAHGSEVVSIENKSDRVAFFENIAVPDAAYNDFALLIRKHNVGQLAGHGTKDIALPIFDLPSRKVGQFLFFANSCCYGSDKCWRFAVIVDCDDQDITAIGSSLGAIGSAGYVSPFRNSHVLNSSPQDIRLDQADRDQQERKYGQQSISELQSAAGNGPVFGNLIAALFGVTAGYIVGFSGLILLDKRRWIYGSLCLLASFFFGFVSTIGLLFGFDLYSIGMML